MRRGLVGVAIVAPALALLLALSLRGRVPEPPPTPMPPMLETPMPEPFEPPVPEDDDLDLPTLPKIAVCHCGTPYGSCVDMSMVRQAARLHALKHDYDLIGRGCASASEEDLALRRVLFRPERIEGNSTATLILADRAAYRERTRRT